MFLSIILPIYDNNDDIGPRLMEIDNYMQRDFPSLFPNKNYEIITVIDGGPKSSFDITKRLQNIVPNVKIIHRKEHKGKGYSIKEGMLKAQGDYRLYTDINQKYPINQLGEYLKLLIEEKKDVIIGSRNIKLRDIKSKEEASKDFLSTLPTKLILNKEISDPQSGFKLFSQKAVETIFPRTLCNDKGFNYEIIAIAKRHHLLVKEIPAIYEKEIVKNKKTFHENNNHNSIIDLCKIKWHLMNGHYE